MSAYIVDKATIDAIVTVWCALEGVDTQRTEQAPLFGYDADHASATAIGQALWNENYRSMNYRYQGRAEEAANGAPVYRFESVPLPRDLNSALPRAMGAIRGLNYQACECDDYEDSRAFALLTDLQSTIRARLGKHDPEWRGVQWTIDDAERHVFVRPATRNGHASW